MDKPAYAPSQIYDHVETIFKAKILTMNLGTVTFPNRYTTFESIRNFRNRNGGQDFNVLATSNPLVMLADDDQRMFLQFAYKHPSVVRSGEPDILNSIYGWAHPELLSYLKGSIKNYLDGTFRCVPRVQGFKQLVVLMVYEERTEEFVPILYALLQNKKEETYTRY